MRKFYYHEQSLPLIKLLPKKDTTDYDEYGYLPTRATSGSAGYDFCSLRDEWIQPGQTLLIQTGIVVSMPQDEVLLLFPRSGLAAKHHITLQNAVGVVDSDYKPHSIGFLLRNEGENVVHIRAGERIGQGVFFKYLTVEHDNVSSSRQGGFGSTGGQ